MLGECVSSKTIGRGSRRCFRRMGANGLALGCGRATAELQSADVLLRCQLHVARGYSLRETVARAKLANRADISHVALLKRLRNSDEWLRLLCMELLNGGFSYCIGLPSLVCDFFEVRATIDEGSGESLNRLPAGPHELNSCGCRVLLSRWD